MLEIERGRVIQVVFIYLFIYLFVANRNGMIVITKVPTYHPTHVAVLLKYAASRGTRITTPYGVRCPVYGVTFEYHRLARTVNKMVVMVMFSG